jgi:hypothetical protein
VEWESEDEDYRKGGKGRRRLKQSKRVERILKRGRVKKEERSVCKKRVEMQKPALWIWIWICIRIRIRRIRIFRASWIRASGSESQVQV